MISLYHAGGAIAAFVVFQHVWLSSLSRNPYIHRALIFICAFIAVFMLATAQAESTEDISRVQILLHWQNLGVFGYIAGLFWLTALLAELTHLKWVKVALVSVTVFTVLLAAISFSMPWGFLLDSVSVADTAVQLDEATATFDYQTSPRAVLVFGLVYLAVLWNFWCTFCLYKNRHPYVASLLLFFTLVIAFLHTGNSLYQLGLTEVDTPRGLTPFFLFFMVALLFGNEQRELFAELSRQRNQLREEVGRRRAAEEKAIAQAYTDELTGLPNRRKLRQVLRRELGAQAESLKLVLIHIDRLRRVKQTFGHENAERFVLEFSRRLMADPETRLLTARISETVFAVLTRSPWSFAVGHTRARGNLRDTRPLEKPYLIGYQYCSPTFSLGVAEMSQHDTVESALHKADLALEVSQMKREKFSVVHYNQQLAEEIALQRQLERDLGDAIKRGQLNLEFQPKVDRDGQLAGAEALVRWQHPSRGSVPPNIFIPLAERSGLMGALGEWVIETCCVHLRDWRQRGVRPCRLSLNVSAWQLQSEQFADDLLAALARHEVAASAITLELTESALLEDIEESRRQLQMLRKVGVRIALDDFGTGFSSLAYLGALPLDELKIDKSFIDALQAPALGARRETKSRQLLHALLDIGNALELTVVAEGIETPAQYQLLRAMGFQYFQGFLFSQPLTEAKFLDWEPALTAS